jgi:hypothetical protein
MPLAIMGGAMLCGEGEEAIEAELKGGVIDAEQGI